jgi:hypothetical protein
VWVQLRDEEGDPFYHNVETGETCWERPPAPDGGGGGGEGYRLPSAEEVLAMQASAAADAIADAEVRGAQIRCRRPAWLTDSSPECLRVRRGTVAREAVRRSAGAISSRPRPVVSSPGGRLSVCLRPPAHPPARARARLQRAAADARGAAEVQEAGRRQAEVEVAEMAARLVRAEALLRQEVAARE